MSVSDFQKAVGQGVLKPNPVEWVRADILDHIVDSFYYDEIDWWFANDVAELIEKFPKNAHLNEPFVFEIDRKFLEPLEANFRAASKSYTEAKKSKRKQAKKLFDRAAALEPDRVDLRLSSGDKSVLLRYKRDDMHDKNGLSFLTLEGTRVRFDADFGLRQALLLTQLRLICGAFDKTADYAHLRANNISFRR